MWICYQFCFRFICFLCLVIAQPTWLLSWMAMCPAVTGSPYHSTARLWDDGIIVGTSATANSHSLTAYTTIGALTSWIYLDRNSHPFPYFLGANLWGLIFSGLSGLSELWVRIPHKWTILNNYTSTHADRWLPHWDWKFVRRIRLDCGSLPILFNSHRDVIHINLLYVLYRSVAGFTLLVVLLDSHAP